MGGSFAKALRQKNLAAKIAAYDSDEEAIALAIETAAIDEEIDIKTNDLSSYDLIILATPLSSYKPLLSNLEGKVKSDAIIIDFGSLKGFISKVVSDNLRANFIACHPIAGSQNDGFANADANLFAGKKFIICKSGYNKENDIQKISDLMQKLNMEVIQLGAKQHDEIYATISHLPQFLSFLTKDEKSLTISDPFFQKAFRLDDSSAPFWSDVFKMNENNLEELYLKFFFNLEGLIQLIKKGKSEELLEKILSYKEHHAPYETKQFDENFLQENFVKIFCRLIVVKSYISLKAVKEYEKYSGNGLHDFCSILAIADYNKEKLSQLLQNNRNAIIKKLEAIS